LNILFRCDGSADIGMGHVIRCLALADELNTKYKCNVHFAMRRSTMGIDQVKGSYSVLESYETEDNFNYASWLQKCVKKIAADVLVLDVRDGIGSTILRDIKIKTGVKVVTIDDPEDKRIESDLAFYPPVLQLEKVNWDDFGGELYVGWEYVILRKEFSQTHIKPKNPSPKILVAMGATDPKGLTFIALNALKNVSIDISIEVLIGNQYLFIDKLKKTIKQIQKQIVIHQSPPNVAEIMSSADVAIISFGVTAYELAAVNTPVLYLCLTKDHALSAKSFDKDGMGVSLGVYSEISDFQIQEGIRFMLQNYSRYKNINLQVDGRGVSRIAKIINGFSTNV